MMGPRGWSLVTLAASLAACKTPPSTTEGAQGAATASAPPAASEQPEPPKPWYFGKWEGSYDAARHVIDMTAAQGAVRDWGMDPGDAGAGRGTLSVVVDEAGTIQGSSKGPLGALTVSGHADDEALRLVLEPAEPGVKAFRGSVVARREGAAAKGTLSASSGDSLTVRAAPVTLERTP